VMEVEANGFLHHMVRNIAGSLIKVGKGEAGPDWIAEALAARDRRLAGVTAPSDGLYFLGVRYPSQYGLPQVFDSSSFFPVS
ncbi:MAG: tRNA pseudouridine(38-40) synthase TruA, partial [Gammaproteobacteria bacterium]